MGTKGKVAITLAVIGLLSAIVGGGGSATNWTFDFSTTTIGQIGDNIINQYFADQGIDIEEFKAMCDRGEVHDEFERYCSLIP